MTEPLHRADPLAAFERERGRLFGVAYRMLSSVSEAEDVLQDAWLRWQAVDPATVENPSDGGGKAHAAKVPLVGAERVAKFLSGLQAKAQVPFEVRLAQVNGRTGFITWVEGRVANVGTMRIEDGLIREIFIQVNPEKLPERT